MLHAGAGEIRRFSELFFTGGALAAGDGKPFVLRIAYAHDAVFLFRIIIRKTHQGHVLIRCEADHRKIILVLIYITSAVCMESYVS